MQYPFSKQEKKIGNTNNKIEHIYDTHTKKTKNVLTQVSLLTSR